MYQGWFCAMPQGEVRGEGGGDQEGICRQLGLGRSWIIKVFLPQELEHLLSAEAAIPWAPNVCVCVLSHVWLFAIPWTVACQASLLTAEAAISWAPNVCVCAQSCLTLCNPMDCSLPGFSVCGIFQARILEWVAISYSRESFQPRIEPMSPASPALAGGFFTTAPPGLLPLPVYLNGEDGKFYVVSLYTKYSLNTHEGFSADELFKHRLPAFTEA